MRNFTFTGSHPLEEFAQCDFQGSGQGLDGIQPWDGNTALDTVDCAALDSAGSLQFTECQLSGLA